MPPPHVNKTNAFPVSYKTAGFANLENRPRYVPLPNFNHLTEEAIEVAEDEIYALDEKVIAETKKTARRTFRSLRSMLAPAVARRISAQLFRSRDFDRAIADIPYFHVPAFVATIVAASAATITRDEAIGMSSFNREVIGRAWDLSHVARGRRRQQQQP